MCNGLLAFIYAFGQQAASRVQCFNEEGEKGDEQPGGHPTARAQGFWASCTGHLGGGGKAQGQGIKEGSEGPCMECPVARRASSSQGSGEEGAK